MANTVAELLATEAKQLSYQELPAEVIHQVKRSMLDTIGVAFGGYPSEPSSIVQNLTRQIGASDESTVWGSGLKTSCLNATLINGVMARDRD
jgi:2-methylcitrate dehydratase